MSFLKTMLTGKTVVVAPLVFDPLGARLAEQAGFKALYLGGGALGYLKTVTEANLGLAEMVQAGHDIMAATGVPLILDGACGWGDAMHMRRTIRACEAAGFGAIEIEDQIMPSARIITWASSTSSRWIMRSPKSNRPLQRAAARI